MRWLARASFPLLLVSGACSAESSATPSVEAIYVGRLDPQTLIALDTLDDEAVLYACAGDRAEWFTGTIHDGTAALTAKSRTAELQLTASSARGTLRDEDGGVHAFSLERVAESERAGLYAEDGRYGRTGAIVLRDGTVVGSYFSRVGVASQVTPIQPVDTRGVLVVRLGAEIHELPRFRIVGAVK